MSLFGEYRDSVPPPHDRSWSARSPPAPPAGAFRLARPHRQWPACRWRRFTSNIALTTADPTGSVPRGAPGSSRWPQVHPVIGEVASEPGVASIPQAPPPLSVTGWTM